MKRNAEMALAQDLNRSPLLRLSTIIEKDKVVEESQETLLLQNFLMGLELHRISIITGKQ